MFIQIDDFGKACLFFICCIIIDKKNTIVKSLNRSITRKVRRNRNKNFKENMETPTEEYCNRHDRYVKMQQTFGTYFLLHK